MTKYLLAAILSAAALSTAASAQVAGTYTGTTADGNNVSFTVTQDAGAKTYSITSENISFTAPCKNSSTTLNTAWGLGYTTPVSGHTARFAYQDSYFYFSGTLHFTGSTLTGTLSSTSPDLTFNEAGRPTKALFCVSPAQSLSATLSTGDATSPAAHPKAVLLHSESVHTH